MRRSNSKAGRRISKVFFQRLHARYTRDGLATNAAALSYDLVFALFPFLFLLATLTAYVPYFRASAETLLARAHAVLPSAAMDVVSVHVRGLVTRPRPHLLWMALLLALYSASRGVDTLRKALNLAHDVAETRPLWKTEALAFGMTGGGGLLLVGAVAGLAAGGNAGLWLAGHVGVAATYVIVWGWLRWPVTAVVVALSAAIGYHVLPNVRQKFKLITPGSLIGTVSWFATTWGFGEYAGHFASYNVTYGAIGGVIVLMTWFYLTGLIYLIGGEINVILETG